MKNLNLSIGAKLWLAVGVVLVAIVIGMAYTNARNAALMDRAQLVLGEQSKRVQLATRWVGLVQTNTARDLAIILSPDPATNDFFRPAVLAVIAQITELQKTLVERADSSEEKAALESVGEARKAVLASRGRALDAKKAGNEAAAQQEAKTVFQPAVEGYLAALQAFADLQVNKFTKLQEEIDSERTRIAVVGRIVAVLILAFMLGGTAVLVRQIRAPLKDAIAVAERIAQGDLTATIVQDRHDEIGEMLQALQHMQQQLQRLVADVRTGTESITTASQEIEVGNHDLSHRTEETASSLEETASSLEHLTSTVQHSTDAARQANQLAGTAAEVAQRGGTVVGQVVSTMQDINTSSQRIADIIGVIDGIAFQTNILALNAAVEAARAGEQGRGFAVVAGEVRSLAQRAAEAAKEIKALIVASVEKVEGGTRLVNDAGTTMQEIVASVQRVSDIISEISAAATEQANELGQVNAAVTQLDQMTQQNAALVEQSAAAASSMKEQAQRLAQTVSAFKLNSHLRLS